jgi:hypothetical protein
MQILKKLIKLLVGKLSMIWVSPSCMHGIGKGNLEEWFSIDLFFGQESMEVVFVIF